MGNEGNIAFGNDPIDSLSRTECELLSTLARRVPMGQAIVALNSGEDEVATWLARGANEATDNKVHIVNIDADYEPAIRRWKEKVGLLWYNASCQYEDIKKALLSWQGHLSPEARVVLHGYDRPGVARVVKEYLGSYGNFVFVDSVDSTVVLAVDRCVHYWVIDYNEFGVCKYCSRKRNFKRLSRESSEIETKRRVNACKTK